MTTEGFALRGVTKSFGRKIAIDGVDLDMAPHRVLSIVGENGAGKSTLMNVLAGVLRPDEGRVILDGEPISLGSPLDAAHHGIAMVHQHIRLVGSLSVAENVFLGRELTTRAGGLRHSAMIAEVEELTDRLKIRVDPRARVRDLPIGVKQRVSLLKALAQPTRLLILDEPTAVLTPQESRELFSTVRHLATLGTATVLITHKLGEVREVADDIAVMRDGRIVSVQPRGDLTESMIARLMVGREVLLRVQNDGGRPSGTRLSLRDVSVVDDDGVRVVDGVSLDVRAGEIVGIAGVEGNGQSELAAAISGTARIVGGSVKLGSEDIIACGPRERRERGIASIPEDRHLSGTAPTMSVWENMISPTSGKEHTRGGWIRFGPLRERAQRLISQYDVRGALPTTPVKDLSGGNAQKVVLAREFGGNVDVLLASQPTRGVDVGAMEYIHRSVIAQRDSGVAVLLISADLNEVTALADRILVLYRGQVVAEFLRGQFDEEQIGLAMAGAVASVNTQEDSTNSATADAAPRGELLLEAVDATEERADHDEVAMAHAPVDPWHQRLRRRLAGSSSVATALVSALLIGAVVILGTGGNPLSSFRALFLGSFDSSFGIAALLVQLAPLLVMAVSVLLSFRAGLFNVGGEGQIYLGAIASAWIATTLTDLPGPVLILVAMAAASIGGVLWAVIPALMRAYLDVDEVVSTLMFNYIAIQLTLLLVSGPLRDPTAGGPMGERVAEQAHLPLLPGLPGASIAIVIAVGVVVVGALLLLRTTFGLGVRRVGENASFAEAIGTAVPRTVFRVMLLSGAIAGFAGALDVLGNTHRFSQLFSPELGFLAVTVALLARLNPWMLLIAAAFYANMLTGANVMQLQENVPFSLVTILQGVIVMVMTMEIVRRRPRRRRTVVADVEVQP